MKPWQKARVLSVVQLESCGSLPAMRPLSAQAPASKLLCTSPKKIAGVWQSVTVGYIVIWVTKEKPRADVQDPDISRCINCMVCIISSSCIRCWPVLNLNLCQQRTANLKPRNTVSLPDTRNNPRYWSLSWWYWFVMAVHGPSLTLGIPINLAGCVSCIFVYLCNSLYIFVLACVRVTNGWPTVKVCCLLWGQGRVRPEGIYSFGLQNHRINP